MPTSPQKWPNTLKMGLGLRPTTNPDVSRITSDPDAIRALKARRDRTTDPAIRAELDAAIAAAERFNR